MQYFVEHRMEYEMLLFFWGWLVGCFGFCLLLLMMMRMRMMMLLLLLLI